MPNLSKYRDIAALSFIPAGINMLIASIYIADTQYKLCLMLISLCVCLVAPCHLVPLPLNKYNKLDASTCLTISLLASVALSFVKPGVIIFAVIIEAFMLFILAKRQIPQKICPFLEQRKRTTVFRWITEPVGWMHYPFGKILCALYYSIVFLVFAVLSYSIEGSFTVFFLLFLLSGACVSLCTVWATTTIVFSKETVYKTFAWKCRKYDIKNVKEIRHGHLRWRLRGAEHGCVLHIAGSMSGDMLLLLSICKKRIIFQQQGS